MHLFVITEPRKFKVTQILALLRVISLNLLKTSLVKALEASKNSETNEDSGHPEHKLVQHHKTCSIQKEGWQSKKKKKKIGEEGDEEQVNPSLFLFFTSTKSNSFGGKKRERVTSS